MHACRDVFRQRPDRPVRAVPLARLPWLLAVLSLIAGGPAATAVIPSPRHSG